MEYVKTQSMVTIFALCVALLFVIGSLVATIYSNRQLLDNVPLVGYAPKITYTEGDDPNFTAASKNFGIENAKVAGAQTFDSTLYFNELANGWVVQQVKDLRIDYGSGTITSDPILDGTAQVYANKLAANCSALNHSDIQTYLGTAISSGTILTFAENIAADRSVQKAYNLLENSKDHFNNMVGSFSAIGVGIATSQNPECAGRVFIVQHFASV